MTGYDITVRVPMDGIDCNDFEDVIHEICIRLIDATDRYGIRDCEIVNIKEAYEKGEDE